MKNIGKRNIVKKDINLNLRDIDFHFFYKNNEDFFLEDKFFFDLSFITYFQLSYSEIILGGTFDSLEVLNVPVLYGRVFTKSIMDVKQIIVQLKRSIFIFSFIVSNRGKFLLVDNQNDENVDSLFSNFTALGHFFHNSKWQSGFLTNIKNFYPELCKFFRLSKVQKERKDVEKKNKRENRKAILSDEEIIKKKKIFTGVKYLRRIPSIVFISSMTKNFFCSIELVRLRIPSIVLVESQFRSDGFFFPIFGSSNNVKSACFFSELFLSSIISSWFKELLFFFNIFYFYNLSKRRCKIKLENILVKRKGKMRMKIIKTKLKKVRS